MTRQLTMTAVRPKESRRVPRRQPTMAMRTASETEVQKAVLELLARHPWVAWAHRMNTGAGWFVNVERGTKRQKGEPRFVRFAFKGCPDIVGQLKDGRFLAIEVKNWDGTASDEQLAFLANVNHFNGVAGIARSVDDAQAIVEETNDGDDDGDPF